MPFVALQRDKRGQVVSIYLELIKVRIVFMVLVACLIGILLAGGKVSSIETFWTLFATALFASGAGALNHYFDRTSDALMERTRYRVLPSGIIPPSHAFALGIALILMGTLIAVVSLDPLTVFLGLLSVVFYVLLYTPMKRLSWLNTSVGAIPGALPALMGWTSVTTHIDPGGFVLFLMVFLWQHVHFYSIAWMYREDYRLAGFQMLPVVKPDGKSTFHGILFATTVLIPISLLLVNLRLAGEVYALGALLIGTCLLFAGVRLLQHRTFEAARVVMLLSLCYLPVILGVICVEHYL
jgi:protoheme IX farnesyltransferase